MSIFPTKILLATDASADAALALSTAVDLANNTNSELHVVTVRRALPIGLIGENPAFGAIPSTVYGDADVEAARRDPNTVLDGQVARIRAEGGNVAGAYVREGERADEAIVHLSDEIEAGLIIMGSRGVGGIKRALMGSVSDSVVRHADCPVLVVRGGPRVAKSTRGRLADLARPYLKELMEVSQESANFASLGEDRVVYGEQVPAGRRTVRMFTMPGNEAPLHSSGTGKVLLAFQPPEVTKAIVRRLELRRFTQTTITDVDQLNDELDRIRKRGYAVDSEEMEQGVRCLAAPVFAPDGKVVAAISISGPASRLDERRTEELVPEIRRIAAAFSDSLKTSGSRAAKETGQAARR